MRSAEDLGEEVTLLRENCRKYAQEIHNLTVQLEQKDEMLTQSDVIVTALVQRIQMLENDR